MCLAATLVFAGCAPAQQVPAASEQPSESQAAEPSESATNIESATPEEKSAEAGDDVVAQLVAEASGLSDLEALAFFEGLADKGLSDAQIIQFFIDLPLSDANKQIHDMYLEEGLDTYAQAYPCLLYTSRCV